MFFEGSGKCLTCEGWFDRVGLGMVEWSGGRYFYGFIERADELIQNFGKVYNNRGEINGNMGKKHNPTSLSYTN